MGGNHSMEEADPQENTTVSDSHGSSEEKIEEDMFSYYLVPPPNQISKQPSHDTEFPKCVFKGHFITIYLDPIAPSVLPFRQSSILTEIIDDQMYFYKTEDEGQSVVRTIRPEDLQDYMEKNKIGELFMHRDHANWIERTRIIDLTNFDGEITVYSSEIPAKIYKPYVTRMVTVYPNGKTFIEGGTEGCKYFMEKLTDGGWVKP